MSYGQQPDEWLVATYRETADEEAFAELVRRYRNPVFRLAVSVLGQGFAEDAEDVAQDVMVKLHQALPGFRGEARVSTWIYRIAFNHALNVKARTRFRAPHVADEALETAPSTAPGPEDTLREEQRRLAVLAGINELPEVYQSALRLHYWMGTSVSDIAAMLDVPQNTVKSYLYRARRLLHTLLAERGVDAR